MKKDMEILKSQNSYLQTQNIPKCHINFISITKGKGMEIFEVPEFIFINCRYSKTAHNCYIIKGKLMD